MAEPPILPSQNDFREDASSKDATSKDASQPNSNQLFPATNDESTVNPFAPTVISTEDLLQGRPRTELTAGYWISIGIVILLSLGLLLVGFLPAWLAIAATIPAAIRVPIIQRKLTRANPEARLPNPVGMIFASYALVSAFAVASSIAFVVICVPTTIAFGFANNAAGVYTVGGSAVISLLMFALLYWASLRLSI